MCGFLAIDSKEFDLKTFDEALAKCQDRGPDMTRVFDERGVTFGFNRLAIMDLTDSGMQPFETLDCTLVCNGEIYNYPELREELAQKIADDAAKSAEKAADKRAKNQEIDPVIVVGRVPTNGVVDLTLPRTVQMALDYNRDIKNSKYSLRKAEYAIERLKPEAKKRLATEISAFSQTILAAAAPDSLA